MIGGEMSIQNICRDRQQLFDTAFHRRLVKIRNHDVDGHFTLKHFVRGSLLEGSLATGDET
jgi:hypothetical protein